MHPNAKPRTLDELHEKIWRIVGEYQQTYSIDRIDIHISSVPHYDLQDTFVQEKNKEIQLLNNDVKITCVREEQS